MLKNSQIFWYAWIYREGILFKACCYRDEGSAKSAGATSPISSARESKGLPNLSVGGKLKFYVLCLLL
jgi:hypothetical protein